MNGPLNRMLVLALPVIERVLGESPRLRTEPERDEERQSEGTELAQGLQAFPMRLNATMLMLNFFSGSALGYPFWILAARVYSPDDVGMASAALSAMRLCSLVALIGIGSAIILLLPRPENDPSDVLSAAFSLAIGTGIAISVAFLLLSTVFFRELGVLASSPTFILTFLVLNVVVVLAKAFDSTFMALRRSDKVLTRSIVQGVVALIVLAVCGVGLHIGGVLSIQLAWIGALLASAVLGYRHLQMALPEHRLRPVASRREIGPILGVGLPNFGLRLTLALPVQLVPLVVIEVLNPASAAYWRAVWMFAMLVMTVPNASSSALFAEASNRPERVDRNTRRSIRLALVLGIPMALAMVVMAEWGLALMGKGYAAAGTTPLRILLIGVIPQVFITAYVARQRVARSLLEPTLFSIFSGTLAVAGAVAGGALYGLVGIAVAWVIAQCVIGLWAAWKIRGVYGVGPASATDVAQTTDVPASIRPASMQGGGTDD